MSLFSTFRKNFFMNTPFLYFTMIILGIACGFSNNIMLQDFAQFISDIFIKIFKCISLPIIALSLIVTLSSHKADQSSKKIWQRTIFYTITTTILAATVSCILYLIVKPSNIQILSAKGALPKTDDISYLEHLSNIIPSSILSPFLNQQVISVLFIGIITGIAIRFIPEPESKKTILNFFQGAHSLFLVITKWIIKIIPLGLFGFISVTVTQIQSGMEFAGIGEYIAIIVLANLIQGFVILPVWLKSNGIPPFKTMKAMLPALSLAFFTKSSAGTLPVTIETAEKNANVNPKVSRLVLPLCTTINMNGCAAFIFTTVLFLMQNHGMEISIGTMILWIFISTIAAVGNAGVPMGCFFLSASLLASMNVPIALLGIIIPFYGVIDMIETSLNVWSDSCVAKVVNTKMEKDVLLTTEAS
ncbi:dicarboxylate/amino acid:cation symporter [Silvanigrella aquatica]|uniref:Dicarboxylate/amino acid:cation symporter n=1 Tax=Silvanigrella aquatica TaxID=1915309 RepID=A0A1L4CZK1_9BACT|nr:dicarboxylate/amino acid:cation symporter [Silvanigrella aquatica]APJ03384.1 dicarboxylate/amino acid:cation symporter [Silvanigrella aquatica]